MIYVTVKKFTFIKEQEASGFLSSLGDKFITEMHLRQPGFTYIACGLFKKKNKERIQKFKETEHSRYIYQKKLDKACF